MNQSYMQWDGRNWHRQRAERVAREPAGIEPAWVVALRVAEAAALRERAQRRRLPSRPVLAVYVGLLVLLAGLGVFSAVQWERNADAEAYAAFMTDRNARLAAQLAERDAAHDDLVQLVELAATGDARETLAYLRLLEAERPALAQNAPFQRMRQSVQDLAGAEIVPSAAAAFETASGR